MASQHYLYKDLKWMEVRVVVVPETILSVTGVGLVLTFTSTEVLSADSPGVVRGLLSSLNVLVLSDVEVVDSASLDPTQIHIVHIRIYHQAGAHKREWTLSNID